MTTPDLQAEPSLDDLLADPVMQMVLERDGLEIEAVRRFLTEMQAKQHLRAA